MSQQRAATTVLQRTRLRARDETIKFSNSSIVLAAMKYYVICVKQGPAKSTGSVHLYGVLFPTLNWLYFGFLSEH